MNTKIQIIIIVLYVILTLVLGLMSRHGGRSSYSFMGANIGIMMCVFASAGEWMGGTSTTGVSEYGFTYGISGSWYTIANGMGIVFLTVLFAKLYRSLGKVTVSGIIGKYLGNCAGMVSAVLLIIVMIMVGASQLVAIGTLGQTLLGLRAPVSIAALGVCIIFYTLFGGMLAVGYTNILHMATIYIGMGIALVVSLSNMKGIGNLQETLPSEYFSFTNIGGSKVFSWIIASVLGACTAQAGIQPILAAKDEKTAVKSSFLTALVVAPFGLLTAMLGMVAKVKFPNLTDAKLALPQLMFSLNPLIGGLVLAAILAAILSTASPIFLASGTLFTKDVYQYFRKDVSEEKVLKVSKLSTLVSGTICIIIAILLYDSTMLLDVVYFAYSIRGSIFVILAMGIYWKHTTPCGAITGMLATAVVGILWVVVKRITGEYPFHPQFTETYASVISAVLFTFVFSLYRKKDLRKDK